MWYQPSQQLFKPLQNEGEAVLINTPVYPPFARSVKLNNRRLITNSLVERMVCLRLTLTDLKRIWWKRMSNFIFSATLTILVDVFGKKKCWRRLANSVKNTVFCWFQMRFTKIWPSLVTSIHSFNTIDPAFKDFAIVLSSATKTFNIAGTKKFICSY